MWLQLSVRIVVAYEEVKNSVNNKDYIESGKNLLICRVQIDILCHLYGIKEDVNNKHELNKVVPLEIQVVVRSYDQLAHLFLGGVSFFVLIFCFYSLLILLFSHDHFMNFLASNSRHHYDDLDLFSNQSPRVLSISYF